MIRRARRSMFLLVSGCAAAAVALAAGDVQAGAGRPAGTAVVAPLNGTGYVALTPARLLDTRVGGATIDGIEAGGGAVGAGQTVTTTVAGRGGVPSTGVGAVALHVTAVDQTVRGYVTVFPTGIALPGTSNLNPIPGAVSSNLVIVPVGAGGKVSLFNSDGTTQLIVDVEGWYPTGSAFHGLTPTRVVDTRPTSTKLGAHETLPVQLAGVAGVPSSGVSAVVLNLTSVGATASTFLTVHASGSPMPATSNLNVQPAVAGANLVVVPVGADGKVSIVNDAGTVHVVVDVLGWYSSGPGFNPVAPARVADTRSGQPLGPHATRTFQITGNGGVPVAGAGSVVFNLTAARQTERTFLTVFPTGSVRPLSSDLNPQPNVVAPNLVIAKLGPDGTVSIYNESGTVDVIVDVVGWQPSFVEARDDTATITEDAPATVIPVLANDVDHDGHPLQVASVTQPANGTAAVVGGGMAVSYTPPANFCNAFSATNVAQPATFQYTLYGGMTASVSVHVTCVDDAPAAVDDTATVTEDAPATPVLVLSNDTDVDGGPLTIASVTQPANGSVALTGGVPGAATGLTYQPNANYCNSPGGSADTFTYMLNGGDTATVSVTVTCVDDLPTAVTDSVTVTEDAAAALPVLANDTDTDAGPLSIGSVTQPANGAVVIDFVDGGLIYTPAAEYCNSPVGFPDTFTYTLNGGSTATVSVAVLCVNDAPSFAKGANQTVLEDAGAQTVNGWATSISAGPPNESAQTVSFNITGNTNASLFSVAPTVSPTGTLTYTPAADANGVATITLTASDDGGTANGGADTSAAQSFTITVTAVNDVPTFTKGADQTVLEDAGAQSVNGWATSISAGPANESAQTVSFPVTGNTNAALFSVAPAVSPSGTLTFTPAVNANGVATITLSVADSGGTANGGLDTSATQSFTITVTAVNDVPTFTKGANQSVDEDAGAQTVNGWATAVSAGPANESAQTVSFEITGNTNAALFSTAPAVSPTGALTYTPAADANGTATVTLRLADDGGTVDGGVDTSATQSFTITVTAVNDVPAFDLPVLPDQWVLQDSPEQTVPGFATNIFSGPADESGQTVTFHVSNNLNSLFSGQPTIDEVTGDLVYTPAAGQTGTATVSVYLADNGGTANGGVDTSATATFDILVSPPNFTPVAQSKTGVNAVGLLEDGFNMITLVATDADDDPLTFQISSQPLHGTLGPLTSVDCAGVNMCTVSVLYVPDADFVGSDSFEFRVNDGTINSNIATVEINVTAVNDVPSFTKGSNQSVSEDSGTVTVNGWATDRSTGPADETWQTLTFNVVDNTNPTLFAFGPAVSTTGVLTFTPAANANGTATITLTASDNGGTNFGGVDTSAQQTFTINVAAVNDAPTFMKGFDLLVSEDSAAATATNWATAISVGPANESGQTATFSASNTNNALFSAQPAVSSNGTLTFTPAANANGSATVTLTLSDNGGTANGGADTSASQTFTITVTAVNDAPTSAGRAYGTASLQTNMRSSFVAAGGLLVDAADAADVAGNAAYTPVLTVGAINSVTPVAGTITTTIAGVGTVVADSATGAFTLDPAAGVTGNVSFTYTVCDSGDGSPASQCSAAATASFDIAGPQIWFVNTAVATTGNGTLTHPFKTLAEADAVDGDGDGVFVYSGTTATGLTLNSGEYLVGQAASGSFDSAFGITPPTTTIARPTLAGSAVTIGGTVTLATNSKVQGVSISSAAASGLVGSGGITGVTVGETSVTTTTGTAVNLNSAAGTYSLSSVSTNGAASGILVDGVGASNITVTGGSIVGATSRGVDINGGSGNVSYGGTITTSATGRSVEITNRTGGTASFTGGISDSGLGINLASNSGATIFLSGVTASTAANTAFTATGGGVITLAGSSNTLTTTTGTALNLDSISSASTITVATVTTNGAANGVLINNIGGATVTINGGAIVGATTRGVDINGGGGAFTYAGTITTTSTGRSVEVTGHSSATVLFSGAINDSGIGVNLTGNTGSTVNFTGGLTASTGGNTAFTATGGGTINVTGSANTLTTTTGTALNVANTTIGSSGLTFRSISVNGAARGIVLDTTGSTAGLTVTGNGGTCTAGNTAGCSGGEIRSTTGADDSGATPAGTGIVLRSTKGPSFTRMYIHDHSNYGIRGTSVDGFTLDSSVVGGVNGSNAASPYNDATIAFDNLTGSATISNSAISGGYADNIRVRNDSGTLDRLTLNTVTVGDNSAADGNDGVLLVSSGSATFKVSVLSSTFTGARGDVLQFNHGGSGAGDLVLTNSHFSNNHSGIATGGGGLTLSNEGTSGATTMNITGNTFRDAVGPGVLIVKATGASVQTGTFSNNTIGVSGAANSGSAEGSALKLQTAGQGTLGWTVTNNQIYGYNNFGIEVLAGGGASAQSGTLNMTITGNTIAEPGNTAGTLSIPKNGIHLNIGTVPGDTYSACAAISANTVFNGGADASPPAGGGQDIRIRQRQNTTVRLPNYAGAANDNTAAQNFLVANNSSGGVPTAITSNTSGSGGGGFTGGAAPCS